MVNSNTSLLPMKVLHALSLQSLGGIECIFEKYLSHAGEDKRLEHHVLLTHRRVLQRFEDVLRTNAASVHYAKYWHGIKLPRHPDFIRKLHSGQIGRIVQPDAVLLINTLGNLSLLEAARRSGRHSANIYYERGEAWIDLPRSKVTRFLAAVDGVICISHATRRILELKWGLKENTAKVLYNGFSLASPEYVFAPKDISNRSVLKLGCAGRFVPLKGMCLALHALKLLPRNELSYELHFAGAGPEEERLRALASELGLAERVTFHGHVSKMSVFYRDMDVIIIPSIREPLGNVCVEASYFGCPVVASAVDGIPEAIAHGETGILIRPSLPMTLYSSLGGGCRHLPGWYYDPSTNSLAEPKLISPEEIAAAIEHLCDSPDDYQKMSAAAHRRIVERHDFEAYVRGLNDLIVGFIEG